MSFYGQILNNVVYGIDKLGTAFGLKSSKKDNGSYLISLMFKSGEGEAAEAPVSRITIPVPSYDETNKSINLTPDVQEEE